MTKRQLINAIHGMLKTDCYSVLWADYYGSVYEDEFESRKEAVSAGVRNPICLVEFYNADSDCRTDCFYGENEMQCLWSLYRLLVSERQHERRR